MLLLIIRILAGLKINRNEKIIPFTHFYGEFRTKMRADEGMWLMMLIKRLNGVDMQKKDYTLTGRNLFRKQLQHERCYSPIWRGCTAEIVSPKGLIFTNHHCGYGAIAAASTPEKDYLTNGFWAKIMVKKLILKAYQ